MIEWMVSSCVLILLILVIRQFFRKRLDLKVRYALWLIVAVRLLVPFSFAESRFSVLNLLETGRLDSLFQMEERGMKGEGQDAPGMMAGEGAGAAEAASGENGSRVGNLEAQIHGDLLQGELPQVGQSQEGLFQGELPQVGQSQEGLFQGELPQVGQSQEGLVQGELPQVGQSQKKPFQGESVRENLFFSKAEGKGLTGSAVKRLLAGVWLCGSLFLGAVIVFVNIRDDRKRRRSRVLLSWKGESRLPVYVSDTVCTPCMAGIFRPAVYLTREAAEEEKQLSYVIAHENMHYRHGDHWWAVVRTVCLCIHWFNPLVWKAARLARQDGELACDADVLKALDREEKVEYGKALLELSVQKDAVPVSLQLATTMSGGKKQLRERLEMIRRNPGRTAGVPAAAAVLAVVALTVTFTGRREADDKENMPGEPLPETDSESVTGDGGQESEASPEGSVFGYHDYTGYLDECVQWMNYEDFTECDYDGDGITDRVWRENIQDWGVADYRIEFGNGDVIELLETAGGMPEVRSLDLDGDGVREILFTETFGYSTDPKAGGQMALFGKTEEGYRMMELPGGMSQVNSEERAYDGTMVRYQPSLPLRYEPDESVDGYRMRVTCPALENEEGLEPLDVMVDFTQETWEMGGYDRFSSGDLSGAGAPYQVDIFAMEDGRDALRLYFGVLDKWCNDDVVMTLEWGGEELNIREIRYRHDYIETAWAEIRGQQYELILHGSGYVGGDRYLIDSVRVDRFYYDGRFGGTVEDMVQIIETEDAAKQYWGPGYASDGVVMAQAVSTSRNGNILVADLDFDGNEDFCIQAWVPEGKQIPYYCYFWNDSTGQFEYGGCLANVEADPESQCIRCTVYEGEGAGDVQYYRYEDGQLRLAGYEDERSAVSPTKEEVLAMRERVLEGMSREEIKRLTENIKVANQRMESAYLYDSLFEKLEDKESLYWNYFDEKGDIQVGWEYEGSYQEMRAIMDQENLSREEFNVRYGTPVMVYNRFDAGNFMTLMEEMKELVQNEKLKEDLQQLIEETGLAAESHEMEHANNIYKILHDMDYFLLRYGPEDVGKYVKDTSTITKYYGVLSVYQ